MKINKLFYLLALSFILFNILYRISPALTNAPVFSDDAWSLLIDVRYLIEKGSGTLVSCSSLPNCNFGYWPEPTIITAVVSEVTSANVFWAPVIVTLFMNILSIISLILIVSRIVKNKLNSIFISTIIMSSLWFTNMFYSGFKAEMIAMPFLILLVYLLLKLEEDNNALKIIFMIIFLFIIIVFTHHFTTYIAISTIFGYFVYKHAINKLSTFDKKSLIVLLSSFLVLTVYYSFQSFSTVQSNVSNGFLPTLFSYYLILLLISGYTLVKGFRKSFLYISIAGILFSLTLSFGMSSFLPGMPPFSIYSISLAPPLLFLLIFGLIGSYIMNNEMNYSLPLITAWAVAPFALVIFSFFEGSGLTLNRGIIAGSLPMIIFATFFFDKILNNRKKFIKYFSLAILLLVLFNGLFIQFQPFIQQRNVYTYEAWYYHMDEINQLNSIMVFIPHNIQIYSNYKINQLATFLNYNFTLMKSNTILISKEDFNNSYNFAFGLGLGYSWNDNYINNKIMNSLVLFNSEYFLLIME